MEKKKNKLTSSFHPIDRVSESDVLKLGSLFSGVVDRVTPDAVIIYVNAKGYSKGTISTEHLADHHGKIFFILDWIFLFALLLWYSLILSLAIQGLLL